MDALARLHLADLAVGRQRGRHLEQRRAQPLADAEFRQRSRHAEHEQRAPLVVAQAGAPVDQADPAAGAALGGDGDAGGAQGFDVAVDRARRDLQRFGQDLGRHAASRLERRRCRDQPVCPHRRNHAITNH